MMREWIKRTNDNNPVKNIQELYDLWLNACHEMYQDLLKSKNYQATYSEFMNKALKFWESTTKK